MLATNNRTERRRLEEALVAAVGGSTGARGAEDLKTLVERTGQDALVEFAIAQRVTVPASEALGEVLAEGPRAKLLSRAHVDMFSNLSHLALLVRLSVSLPRRRRSPGWW